MKTYNSKSEAVKDYAFLKHMYEWFREQQVSLRKHLRDTNRQDDAPFETRMHIFAYRKAMNALHEDIRQINKEIRRLDVESTERQLQERIKRDSERCKKTFDAFKGAEVVDKNGIKYYVTEEHHKEIMDKINKAADEINRKTRKV